MISKTINRKNRLKFKRGGFTLIEIIISIAILAIIAVFFLSIFTNSFATIFTMGNKTGAAIENQNLLEAYYSGTTTLDSPNDYGDISGFPNSRVVQKLNNTPSSGFTKVTVRTRHNNDTRFVEVTAIIPD